MRVRNVRMMWVVTIILGAIAGLHVSAQGSDPAAIAAIKSQAARNDPDALFALALIHEVGRDGPKDMGEAVRLLQRGASLGHAPSKTQLGLMYQTGTGVPKDLAKAYAFFNEAARVGDAEGQFRLGMALAFGLGTAKDGSTARHWLAGAANQEHQEAQYALGVMLLQGVGGQKNEFAARRWLRVATSGSDSRLSMEAGTIVQELDKRLLYNGVTPQQLLTGAVLTLGFLALVADLNGVDVNLRNDPADPLNPTNYNGMGTTKRRQRCRFVSRRSGQDITHGKGAFNYGAGNMWVCD